MTSSKLPSFLKKRWLWLLILIVALGGGGYYAYTQFYAAGTTEVAAAEELQTATVQRGELIIYASGSGSLVAADEASFGFETDGQVESILVSVGEQVETGQVLAELDNVSQQLAYNQAKRELAELTSPYNIATTEQAIVSAITDVETARKNLSFVISPAVLRWEEEITRLEEELAIAKKADDEESVSALDVELVAAQETLEGSLMEYENNYLPKYFMAKDRETNKKYVAAPSEVTVAEVRAAYRLALATLEEAENYLAALQGADVPADATGESLQKLLDAQLTLASAEDDLNSTQLVAPLTGTIMSLDFTVGDTVSENSKLVTIANLAQKNIEIYLDETDWDKVVVGYPAEVTFDALPDDVFNGTVIQVDPGLYSSNNSSVVRGIVALDSDVGINLPVGNSAAVDVIAAESSNALLVPIEALHQAGEQYAVFVMEDGSPRLHIVEVGIQDILYAEIISGLNSGDTVTTGIVETQ